MTTIYPCSPEWRHIETESLHHHHSHYCDEPILEHSHPWNPADEDEFCGAPTHSHAGHYTACDWTKHHPETTTTHCDRCAALPQPDDGTCLCDDHFFHRFGDMLSINELQRLDLHWSANQKVRAKYLAEYESAGLDPDRDPSYFELTARVSGNELIVEADG